jgi:hypothetical protein
MGVNEGHLERTAHQPRDPAFSPMFLANNAQKSANPCQSLHKVIVKRIDEINNKIRLFRLEIPGEGSVKVRKWLSL